MCGHSTPLRDALPLVMESTDTEMLMADFDLSMHGITVKKVLRNVAPSKLYEEAIRFEPGTTISDTGALIAYSGDKTGRSPQDKRLVRHPASEGEHLVGSGQFSTRPGIVRH